MRRAGLELVAVALLAALALASSATANTFKATKRGDPPPNGCKSHDCSLREAIRAANHHHGADTVLLPSRRTYNLSIANSNPSGDNAALEGDLDVTDDPLVIVHPGAGRATVDANLIDRVFEVFDGAPTTFKRVGVEGGADPSSATGEGGGIRSDASLTLVGARVSGNQAIGTGAADGGGIAISENEHAALSLVRTVVSNNHSDDDGGGVSIEAGNRKLKISRSKLTGNSCDDFGGGVYVQVPGTIARTTVSENQCQFEAGGIGIEEQGPLTIKASTVSRNLADASDVAGGIYTSNTDTRIVNSTIAANTGGTGAGLYATGDALSLNAVTIARNVAFEDGGGLFPNSAPPKVENSVIALNEALGMGDDCMGSFDSRGHNVLSTTADCTGFNGPADLVTPDPKLGSLGSHGGPTKTIPLKKGSPAIGHAKRSTAPHRDQRGRKRDRHPDSGAFERL